MNGNRELKIKQEFKNLIRPLRRQEYIQLEDNILRDGCMNPIITWHGYIVDGHNRYEICQKHDIHFEVKEISFNSEDEAIIWICANQLGRRNISDETRKFLIGMQYETEKIVNARKNSKGQNQYTVNDEDDLIEEDIVKEPYSSRSKSKTAKRIAEENNISAGTVQKYALYTRALETIGEKEPELVPKILSGRYKLSHDNVLELSKLSQEELHKVNKRFNRGHQPFFTYNDSRDVVTSMQKNEAPQQPSVKDMPEFDPDAEVTELTLTIPSWIGSINRTIAHAHIDIVSDTARMKLAKALNTLKDTIDKMLEIIKEG